MYELVYDYSNLYKSAHDCCLDVMWKHSTQSFKLQQITWCSRLRNQLKDGTYKSKGFTEFDINERGKMRHIQSVHITERCVQKSLANNVLKPAIIPKLIYDNAASLKGKGTDFTLRRLKCHLQRHYRKYGTKGGILLIDFHNYFGSINHAKLLEMIKELNLDDGSYKLTADFINAFEGDCGIGLGSEICQICAIFYPNKIDHYIKEQLHIKGYGRYMDDSYLISDNIDYLKKCLDIITDMCNGIGITINEKRTQIVKFNKGNFLFLKKRIRLLPTGKILMRLSRKNITKRRRKLRLLKEKIDLGRIDFETVVQSYQSWKGYAKRLDSMCSVNSMHKLFMSLFKNEYIGFLKDKSLKRKQYKPNGLEIVLRFNETKTNGRAIRAYA